MLEQRSTSARAEKHQCRQQIHLADPSSEERGKGIHENFIYSLPRLRAELAYAPLRLSRKLLLDHLLRVAGMQPLHASSSLPNFISWQGV